LPPLLLMCTYLLRARLFATIYTGSYKTDENESKSVRNLRGKDLGEENKKKSNDENERNGRTLEAFLGLLDDYSDRSIGWGGFFVASMFGMYALLSVVGEPVPGIVWIAMYLLLWIFGGYSMANFLWYFDLTNRITAEIRMLSPEFQMKMNEMFEQSEKGIWFWMHKFARWRVVHPRFAIILFFSYYVTMTWLPLVVVLFWMKSVPLFP